MSKNRPSSNRKAIGIQDDNHKQIRKLAREGSANFNDVIGALLELTGQGSENHFLWHGVREPLIEIQKCIR